jgi:diguanylate cyclase (GGDEF)-like protein
MRHDVITKAQVFRRVFLVTAISVVSSFVLTLLAMRIVYGANSNTMIPVAEFENFVFALSILAPTLICPPVCYKSAKLVHDLNLARSELQVLAQTDQLTGLLNRRGFDAVAQASLDAARAAQSPVAVLMCDIDHFKRLNDGFGHDFGDKSLMHVAAVLRGFAESHKLIVGRQGGDEFVMMLPGARLSDAAAIAEDIRVACAKMAFERDPIGGSLSVSIGVAASERSEASLSALLRRADVALYDVKRSGRNRVVTADVNEHWSSAA